MKTDSHKAIADALKVLYFIVQHNLSLYLFYDLVDLMNDLGSDNLKHLKLAKTPNITVQRSLLSSYNYLVIRFDKICIMK